MSSKPLVSIIIPILNAEKFIKEAIESVFAQTYNNWELLLIDDGSTDDSTEIALRYAKQHRKQVRYFEHDGHLNRGVCASRNLGMKNAAGAYIALLDADDVWLPHKLEQQAAILDTQLEAAMVYGFTQYWHSWTQNPEDIQRDYVPELGVPSNTLINPPTLLALLYPLGKATAPSLSNLIVRRELIERIGGFEEDFRGPYQLYEDQAFLTKVYLAAPVFVASECWDKYRQHKDSCVSIVMKAGQYREVRLFFLKWLEVRLSEQRVKDVKVWNALHEALWPYHHPNLHRLMKICGKVERRMKEALKPVGQGMKLIA